MVDKLCINHPVEMITKIYHFHDNIDLFPFLCKLAMKGWRARNYFFILSLVAITQSKTMGKSKYFSILQHIHQKKVFEYLSIFYI